MFTKMSEMAEVMRLREIPLRRLEGGIEIAEVMRLREIPLRRLEGGIEMAEVMRLREIPLVAWRTVLKLILQHWKWFQLAQD